MALKSEKMFSKRQNKTNQIAKLITSIKASLHLRSWEQFADAISDKKSRFENGVFRSHFLHPNNFSMQVNLFYFGGSPGLVVKGGDSQSEGCEFESRHRILDGHFSHFTCCKNCNNVCLKRPKIHGLAHFENLFCLRAQR